jgi:hypothetical protein
MRNFMLALAVGVLAAPCLPAIAQTHRFQTSTIATLQSGIVAPTPQNWFVRPDGGTRYSVNVTLGQCDGKADVSYASTGGTGVNQHCAFNDVRYMWSDNTVASGAGSWVMAGGDALVIRGCKPLPSQANPSGTACRLGYDMGLNGDVPNGWCYGVGPYSCYNPPIPAGTSAQPTRILGACAYGTYTCTPGNLGPGNLTQLFGGFGLVNSFNLQNTHDVIVAGIELTTHNGVCSWLGVPAYKKGCNNNPPLDDYAQNGFFTDNASANITLQDVYIHGFNASGIYGPIGGAITMIRVASNFNAFAGWNFDDQVHTPDAPGSSITARYVTMIGNGCYEEYPVVHGFPARSCYNSDTGGFGDAWSGQDTMLDSFLCDHCVMADNTKDAFIGPHTQIKHLVITNSFSGGNGGQQWKWGSALNSDTLFQNNLTVADCLRMTIALPGAVQSFNQSTLLPGSYLPTFCRAGADGFSILTRAGSTMHFYGNTIIAASTTVVDFNCGYVDGTGPHEETNCQTSSLVWTGNNILGYKQPSANDLPGLWYFNPDAKGSLSVQSTYNNEFGIRNGDTCGVNNNTCVDPLLVGEPSQTWVNEAALDVFNPSLAANAFYPSSGSPLRGAGTPISGLPTDFYGAPRPTPSGLGAVEFAGAIAPPPPPPPPPVLITPTITWTKPASIVFGAALTSTQLNATTSVAGTFTYTPAAGTVPAVGTDTLSATFTPVDPTTFTSATASVQLVVTQPACPVPPSVTTTCTTSVVKGKMTTVCISK